MIKLTFSPNARRRLNRAGFAAMLIFVAGLVVGIFAPHRYSIGPISISMHGVRNPMLGLLAGYVVWRSTYDGFGRWLRNLLEFVGADTDDYPTKMRRCWLRLVRLWECWNWRQRIMLVLLVFQGVFVLRFWGSYPGRLNDEREGQANSFRLASYGPPGHEISLLEHFCQTVCEQTPADARILFHGHTPAMRFAYEVFPRRVFMLPQEMTAMAESWHAQPQLRDLPPDPHEPYWHQFLPKDAADPAAFIRQHEITYVATFDEYDLSRCRLEPAP